MNEFGIFVVIHWGSCRGDQVSIVYVSTLSEKTKPNFSCKKTNELFCG